MIHSKIIGQLPLFKSSLKSTYKPIFSRSFVQPSISNYYRCRSNQSQFQIQIKRYASYRRFDGSSNQQNLYDLYYRILTSRTTLYVGGGLLVFYIYNLHEAPYTHRRRFIWIPYWIETKIGDYSYRQIMAQYGSMILPHSNPLYGRISSIMNRLLKTAIDNDKENPKQQQHLKNLHWEINIIQNDKLPPNAFILPNGKIFIFSSILPICENDDGIATVLAHELSHQLAQHSSEQLSSQPIYMFLSTVLYSLTGISWFNDLLINGIFTMPASREMETEADHIGCEILAASCYNPDQAIQFWKRMGIMEQKMTKQQGGVGGAGSSLVEWFSTHPATNKRIHDIESWMPHLREISESSGCYEYGKFHNFNTNFFNRQR
ncbi:OMA1 [Candida pseudojiufengensis]|uniref:OMA1 n=1 Tax=Candida pseudojiufengensis TaxID=497109 RepID=UPI0022245D6C|nr:OMA1 [Candida pseudojiufengensis]KAI5965789.1 OMA1 [Candida pseudojiufengensis]